MKVLVFSAILSVLFVSASVGDEVFRRKLDSHHDAVLSLDQDDLVRQVSYTIWAQPLPLDAARAIEIAQKMEELDRVHQPFEKLNAEFVELVRYDHHEESNLKGKYFYFVKLRVYTKYREQLSSVLRYWAVFPTGELKIIKVESR